VSALVTFWSGTFLYNGNLSSFSSVEDLPSTTAMFLGYFVIFILYFVNIAFLVYGAYVFFIVIVPVYAYHPRHERHITSKMFRGLLRWGCCCLAQLQGSVQHVLSSRVCKHVTSETMSSHGVDLLGRQDVRLLTPEEEEWYKAQHPEYRDSMLLRLVASPGTVYHVHEGEFTENEEPSAVDDKTPAPTECTDAPPASTPPHPPGLSLLRTASGLGQIELDLRDFGGSISSRGMVWMPSGSG